MACGLDLAKKYRNVIVMGRMDRLHAALALALIRTLAGYLHQQEARTQKARSRLIPPVRMHRFFL